MDLASLFIQRFTTEREPLGALSLGFAYKYFPAIAARRLPSECKILLAFLSVYADVVYRYLDYHAKTPRDLPTMISLKPNLFVLYTISLHYRRFGRRLGAEKNVLPVSSYRHPLRPDLCWSAQ